MDEFTADAFVNRDEPVPEVTISTGDDHASDVDDSPSRGHKVRKVLSSSKLKDKLHDVRDKHHEPSSSLQDRLFARLLQQIVPTEDMTDVLHTADKRSSKYINRPGFSLPLMTNNFRRFNARIGVVFVFQNRVERLLTWRVPAHTLSFLAVYTFVCIDPYILAILPVAVLLLFVMVPSFLARHPPPPTSLPTDTYSIRGPPLAPPPSIKPANEMSKDFFRNMRDLQNCMEDFSRVHDKMISIVAPPTNFSNEPLSSSIFLILFIFACSMFLVSNLLPWRAISLFAGWAATSLGHPTIQRAFLSAHQTHLRPRERQARGLLDSWVARDIVLDSAPEIREVEIFELQRRSSNNEWEAWIFSPSPYDPLSSGRISGDRPKGTRFFEDVQPPTGWEWSDKKWTLDLLSSEWVEDRMVTGVEVEMEGERWVFDILYEGAGIEALEHSKIKGKERKRDWEEGNGGSIKGRWKRRRWVRTVKRKPSTKKP
ncbi:MAG: hypothetical protein M1835_006891 [Candelina submexicana]|nr:MAG: hypothetical protein M1835_006891 [Candelina submexicana]